MKKNALENTLSEPGFVDKACIHEAGHLLFFAEIGVAEFHYMVPYMEHDGIDFDYTLAAIRPKRSQDVDIDSELALPELAKASAAGGVFLRELRNEENGRDGDDKTRFYLQCIRLGLNSVKEDLWDNGRKAVEGELSSKPTLKDRAERMARLLRPKLFLRILISPPTTQSPV